MRKLCLRFVCFWLGHDWQVNECGRPYRSFYNDTLFCCRCMREFPNDWGDD